MLELGTANLNVTKESFDSALATSDYLQSVINNNSVDAAKRVSIWICFDRLAEKNGLAMTHVMMQDIQHGGDLVDVYAQGSEVEMEHIGKEAIPSLSNQYSIHDANLYSSSEFCVCIHF